MKRLKLLLNGTPPRRYTNIDNKKVGKVNLRYDNVNNFTYF